MVEVRDDLLIARPIDAGIGYTYTLASRLGEILRAAEEQYGPRDTDFTVLGFEFCGNVPQIWFPGNCQHIIIQLTPNSMNCLAKAVFQLAHETIHLLDPVSNGNASVFEEGVATLFSEQRSSLLRPLYVSSHPKYKAAARLAKQALYSRPEVIKVLRARGNRFSDITSTQLLEECPELDQHVAETLCRSFLTWDFQSEASL